MLGYQTVFQIVLVVISVVIITTYIRPTFVALQDIQDSTKEYQEVLNNANLFIAELDRLTSVANSFSASEQKALDRYLPTSIDQIMVMRDIQTIVAKNEMKLVSLSAAESGVVAQVAPVAAGDPTRAIPGTGNAAAAPVSSGNKTSLHVQKFQVGVSGTYEQLKSLLHDFERNAFPLEVASLSFGSTGESGAGGTSETTGDGAYNLTLETYAFTSTGDAVVIE